MLSVLCDIIALILKGLDIVDDKMILNDAGKAVNKWYSKLESKFITVATYDMVIMPNHFHCILKIKGLKDENEKSSLKEIIQWFKTMSTNEYIRGVEQLGWPRFDGKLWQRSYWDHIIRNQKTYESISEYIYYNPMNWKNDELYKP